MSVCVFAISDCFFSSLPNSKYSNFYIVAAFSNKSFSGETSLPVRNSYLSRFPDDEVEILAVCLSKSYQTFFCFILLSIISIFFTNSHFKIDSPKS